MKSEQLQNYRQYFPILKRNLDGKPLIYFDNAATTQKPTTVIGSYQEHYEHHHANVHRASHTLSSESTVAFEASRHMVQTFINASSIQEIIWTKGATESLNLIAQCWGSDNLNQDDEIILSYSEHHANIVPWQMLAEKTGANIKVVELTSSGIIDTNNLKTLITAKTKVIAVGHISNVVGKINPLDRIMTIAKAHDIVTVIDGSQAVAHVPINVQALDCDFYVFSAHKMYGPNSVGVLYGRKALLEKMSPYQGGGEMIAQVSFSHTSYNELPFKFEAGTPNISGVIGFGRAIDLMNHTADFAQRHETELLEYAYQKLKAIPLLNWIFKDKPDIPLFSFTINNIHNYDVAAFLNTQGIAIRSGHHCAMPLMTYKNITGCLRVSLAAYNTFSEIDVFIECLTQCVNNSSSMVKHIKKASVEKNSFSLTERAVKSLDKPLELSSQEEMLTYFSGAKSWDSRHRLIMLLGKKLERLPQDKKSDDNLITGCESSAWLHHEVHRQCNQSPDEVKLTFRADSEAKVIRGLLMVVLAAVNGKSPEEIKQLEINSYFEKLGLTQHLSPSRGNGLNAIVMKVKEIAEFYLAITRD